jgi:hypothetical protein
MFDVNEMDDFDTENMWFIIQKEKDYGDDNIDADGVLCQLKGNVVTIEFIKDFPLVIDGSGCTAGIDIVYKRA